MVFTDPDISGRQDVGTTAFSCPKISGGTKTIEGLPINPSGPGDPSQLGLVQGHGHQSQRSPEHPEKLQTQGHGLAVFLGHPIRCGKQGQVMI